MLHRLQGYHLAVLLIVLLMIATAFITGALSVRVGNLDSAIEREAEERQELSRKIDSNRAEIEKLKQHAKP